MKIVAIGGGKLRNNETFKIDSEIVRLTGKRRPNALFIPTASGDDEEYCGAFDKVYGDRLNCHTDHLLLLRSPEQRRQARKMILNADLIYVGGGNTLRMMKLWRRLGIDRHLRSAGHNGTVLCGLSAGAICWHRWGHSDSRSFAGKQAWSYIRVTALGLVPGIYCPHLDGEKRHDSLVEMVKRVGGFAIASDNHSAVVYEGNNIRCISSRRKSRSYLYRKTAHGVEVTGFKDGQAIRF